MRPHSDPSVSWSSQLETMLRSLLKTAFLLFSFMSLPVWQVVWQSEEGGAAGLGVELFSGAAQVPEPQCEQTAPPAGRRLHLPAAQSPLPVSLLLPGPTQPLSMCSGTRGFINGEWREVLTLVLVKKSHEWFEPPCAGELAVEEHCGAGPAVDAQVSEARLAPRLLPDTIRTGRLEETLHPDSPGAAAERPAGQEIQKRFKQLSYLCLTTR